MPVWAILNAQLLRHSANCPPPTELTGAFRANPPKHACIQAGIPNTYWRRPKTRSPDHDYVLIFPPRLQPPPTSKVIYAILTILVSVKICVLSTEILSLAFESTDALVGHTQCSTPMALCERIDYVGKRKLIMPRPTSIPTCDSLVGAGV